MSRTRVTCLDCGTEFVRPNGYEGNYCPSCHRAWSDAAEDSESDADVDAEPRGPHPAGPSSTERIDDDDTDAPSRYDEE